MELQDANYCMILSPGKKLVDFIQYLLRYSHNSPCNPDIILKTFIIKTLSMYLLLNTLIKKRSPHHRSSFCTPGSRTLLILFSLFLIVLNSLVTVQTSTFAQSESPEEKAIKLLESLSPEERVGQLVMVTFNGMQVEEDSHIYDLVVNHHVGGVILLSENDNLIVEDGSLDPVIAMNRQLQLNEWYASQKDIQLASGETHSPSFIPLFVGIMQEGDGYPYDQILSGLSPLPNKMAIGATWNPDLAEGVGNTLGYELSRIGVNLLLGPGLDVSETPQSESTIDLRMSTFGGNPYWVGKMGASYINGVHEGSNGKVIVVAKHFPGIGGADRLPDEEVATVRKSIEQLNNNDLAPFFTITGNAPTSGAMTDGLLVPHVRYQGFQGNIHATTRPISFDPQAFSLLMNLPALSTWRESGGIMVSDDLGSQSIRRYYDSINQSFDARRIALNAFIAGSDLLYLGDLSTEGGNSTYIATKQVLEYFAVKYREDSAFAQRVDDSVIRILTLKYKQYPSFAIGHITPVYGSPSSLGTSSEITFEVAQQAATLISPSLAELNDAVPDPPNQSDRLVIISDSRSAKQCNQCPPQFVLDVDALKQAIVRLYGPSASDLVRSSNITSYSFENLEYMLERGDSESQIAQDLNSAHWIIFAMLNISDDVPASHALQEFLSERPDIYQQKRLIVFALDAPNYLDATNISKLTAYYGIYGKSPNFIDVAARLLFHELHPVGALPVSVSGIGYDLISATSPNPDQVIPLYLENQESQAPDETATPQPTATIELNVSDLVQIRTGVILDHNGHIVPNETPVKFIVSIGGETNALRQDEITTDGVARTTIQVTSSGTWEIRVESGTAIQSDIIRFDIPAEGEENLTKTISPQSTDNPPLTPTPTIVSPAGSETENVLPPRPNIIDWFLALAMSTLIALATYRFAALVGHVRWGVRSGFLALIGGLIAYIYLALRLPGGYEFIKLYSYWSVAGAIIIGSAIGILITWCWRFLLIRFLGSESKS